MNMQQYTQLSEPRLAGFKNLHDLHTSLQSGISSNRLYRGSDKGNLYLPNTRQPKNTADLRLPSTRQPQNTYSQNSLYKNIGETP
jgi:hypothetical protein